MDERPSARGIDQVADKLLPAAKERKPVQGIKAWNYGWSVEEYRRSARAAIDNGQGEIVQLTPQSVTSFEEGVAALLKRSEISQYWDAEELWGLVASLVASLPWDLGESELRSIIKARLSLLVSPGPSLVAFPLANVQWKREPMTIADCVLGVIGSEWLDTIVAEAKGRPTIDLIEGLPWWLQASTVLSKSAEGSETIVGMAAWLPAQRGRAFDLARERFETVLSLTLILEPNLEDRQLYSGRGDSHRPGIRGLTIDRQSISPRESSVPDKLSRELAAETYQSGLLGSTTGVHWYGEKPFPLDELLSQRERKKVVEELVIGVSSMHGRFRTAARWYAKAHWSLGQEDAVLSLGIALDALLGEKSGSPGRVVADRFALLERNPAERADKAKLFNKLYSARSSVAHGARAKELDEPYFARRMAASVQWVVKQLLARMQAVNARSEDDHRRIFDDLKWGTAAW